MHEGILATGHPSGLDDVCRIFQKTGGIDVSEEGILREIGRGFADIIPAGPDILACAERAVTVIRDETVHAPGAPVGGAVVQRGTLLILIGQQPVVLRKMIDSPALHGGCSLTSVDTPMRELYVVFVIDGFQIIIAGEFEDILGLLRVLPGHEVGGNGVICIVPRIVPAHGSHQPLCDGDGGKVIGVRDLISAGPHDNGGMVPVAADPGFHIPLTPVMEEDAVVILCLRLLPHIKSIGIDEDAHFISKFHESNGRRIVAGANGVYPQLFQFFNLPASGFFIKCRAQCPQIMMHAGAMDLYASSVQEEAIVRREFDGAKTDLLRQRIRGLAIMHQTGFQRIKVWILDVPANGRVDRQNLGVDSGKDRMGRTGSRQGIRLSDRISAHGLKTAGGGNDLSLGVPDGMKHFAGECLCGRDLCVDDDTEGSTCGIRFI